MTRDDLLLRSLDEHAAGKPYAGRRSDRLAAEMYRRMSGAGIRTMCREFPWLPKYFVGQDEPILDAWYEIGAGFAGRPLAILPSALVVLDCEFYDAYYGVYRRPGNPLRKALWTGPIRVQGPGYPDPDPRYWSDCHVLAGVCALAQQPDPTRNPGSLRCWKGWHQRSAQVFLDQQRGEVVAHCNGTDPGHNRAYVFRPEGSEDLFGFRLG